MPWFVVLIGLSLVAFYVALLRANEMFVIAVRDGRCLVMRGRIPSSLRAEIADVIERARVSKALLRVVRSGGKARLIARGIDEHVAQRLRNVVGLYPDHKLKAAPELTQRNLGQRLGLPWLAFRLEKSDAGRRRRT